MTKTTWRDNMKLPTKIKVAAFDIEVVKWPFKEATAYARFGEFSCLEQLIRIDETMNTIKTVDTLIHELNHAIYWAYGIDDADKEERIVGTFATAWTQVYRDNPELLAFITESLRVK